MLIQSLLKRKTPCVMGVLNLNVRSQTPKARCLSLDEALRYADRVLAEGADLLDIGAEPTNPASQSNISIQEELDLILPVMERLHGYPLPISIDTSQLLVMQACYAAGASIFNDVRSFKLPGTLAWVAKIDIPICIMHMAFPFGQISHQPETLYPHGVVQSVYDDLKKRLDECQSAGVAKERIIIDPGFGHGYFGKNLKQNLQLLKHLSYFKNLGYPILVGLSRKTFIGELLNLPIEERLPASLAATTIAVLQGAHIIRTHDVKETVEAILLTKAVIDSE